MTEKLIQFIVLWKALHASAKTAVSNSSIFDVHIALKDLPCLCVFKQDISVPTILLVPDISLLISLRWKENRKLPCRCSSKIEWCHICHLALTFCFLGESFTNK